MSTSVGRRAWTFLEHRRRVPVPALRGQHVHLPRILVEHDTCRSGNGLALVHQGAHQVAESRGSSSAANCGS